MATSSRSAERFKYGICLNDECPMCKSKTVQQIPMRKDLVCSESGKPLRESLPPGRKGLPKPSLYGLSAAALVAIGLGALFATGTFESKDEGDAQVVDTIEKVEQKDSVVAEPVAEPVKEESAQAAPQAPKPAAQPVKTEPKPASGTVNLGYGTYTGATNAAGQPHGSGTITYNSAHQSVESKDYVAQPGETVTGVFRDGKVQTVIWYKSDGTQQRVNR